MENKININQFNSGDKYIVGYANQEFCSIANNTTMALTGKTVTIAKNNKLTKIHGGGGGNRIEVIAPIFGNCHVLAESLKKIDCKLYDIKKLRKTISVDFDDTICYTNFPDIIKEVPNAIKTLNELQEYGYIIIINTCRTDTALDNAIDYMFNKGFVPDLVNENLKERINMFGSDSRKISADYYIDDKNIDCKKINWNKIKRKLIK